MKKTTTYCDVCGTAFKEREVGGPRDVRRTVIEGNIILRLEGRGSSKYPPDNLVMEVCEDREKACRQQALDTLIQRLIDSEQAP